MTKTQEATIAKLRELLATGPVDVTYGGIKGVNRSSLYALMDRGVVVVDTQDVPNRNYPNVFVTGIEI